MAADTIFAQSSGLPPAGVAVIRISGVHAHEAGRLLAGSLPAVRRAALRRLRDAQGETLDTALVLRFDAPASATGEDVVELHCHGGRAVVRAVMSALAQIDGLREARAGEFTRRGFENGRIDLTEAEGLADLLEAETESQRRAALALVGGTLRAQVEHWRDRVVGLSAAAEFAIDYVDEEDAAHVENQVGAGALELAAELHEWLEQPRAEVLKQGVRVVFAGPPNAGKSSLLNALAGEERAIVTHVPGTTRDLIEVPVSIGGVPFVLVDTAGLRESADEVEQIGVRLALREVQGGDLLLWLGDPKDAPAHAQLIQVHAQMDRADRTQVPAGSLGVSAVTGRGLSELREALLSRSRMLLPAEGSVALNRRHAEALTLAQEALSECARGDAVLAAESLRIARTALDRVVGRAGMEDVLDSLFGRFCLGK